MRHESAASGHAHEGSVTPLQPLGGLLRSVLARLFHRRSSPPNPNNPPSNRSSSSLPISASRALGGLAVVLALTVGLLFLLPGGPLHAQEAAIEYAENGTGPVATYTAVDPEGTAIKWSLAGLDAGDFSIDGGALSFKKSPDYETPKGGGATGPSNTYSVTVVATDATRKASMKEVTVNVTNVDEPGTVKLTTLAPRAGIALTASVSDPDSAPADVTGAVWQWAKSQNGTSGWGDIDKATLSTYMPADGDAGYYLRAMVTYKDRESVRDTKTAVGVSANAVKAARSDNDAPEFTDEDDGVEENQATREVAENTAAGEAIGDPIVAEDDDGDVLTYTLYDDDDDGHSALFAIDWATGQLKTKGKLDFETTTNPGPYMVVVRATDPDGMPEVAVGDVDTDNSDVITVTITVTAVDEAPAITGDAAITFAENHADITTALGTTYTANDPEESDGPTLALTGADRGKFNFDIASGALTFKATPDYEKPGDADKDNVYEVTVEATDAVSNTGTKNVKITVTNVEEDGTVTMSQLQPRVGVAITASVTDLDGDVSNVTWQWYGDPIDSNDLTLNAIAKAASATYKPVAADVAGKLFARAMYTDGFGEGESAMGESTNVVEVDTRNKPPVFDDQDDDTDGVQNDETTREVAENTAALGPVGSPVTATDSDPNSDPLDYTLSGADAGLFSVGADNSTTADVDEGGQIKVKSGTKLDYETEQTYNVTLKAADSFGDYDTIDVTIMVTQVNEAPPVMGEATVDYAENGAGPVATYTAVDPEGTAIKWSLAGLDAGDFSIDGGALSFKKSPDYETPKGGGATGPSNTYSVTVVATDATRRVSMKPVTVTVTNVDEPGTVKLTTLAPRAGIALTASVSDPDGNETGHVWQWAKSRRRTSGWGDIDKATSATYTPLDGDSGDYLRATVTYKDRESVRDTKTAVGVSANAVKAARSDNDAPEFTDEDDGVEENQATREVAENTAAGEAIGDPIVAEDDDGDVLTYTLYDDDDDGHSALFAIDWATGQLKTKGKLDFETTTNPGPYMVVVRATDPDGMPEVAVGDVDTDNSDVITVTITVTAVDEAPAITGDAAITFAENHADITTALGTTYTANDPEESDGPTLALTGADRGKFNFDIASGALTFKATPDYEKPGDADKDNVYEVTVEATDAVSNTGTKNVKITVTNVEEDGTVTMSQLQPRVGVAITASVTDLDGDVSNVTWQWYGDPIDSNDLTLNAIAKAASATYKPVAADVDGKLFARAMYTDGFGEGESAMGESTNVVEVDTRNKPPVFDDQDDDTKGVQNEATTREVAEKTKAVAADDVAVVIDDTADNVGAAVTAKDPNEDALVYTLEGGDAAQFAIDRTTGQIEVGAGTKLDYETQTTYMVTVRVTDSFGDSDTIAVTIMVTDMDEAPEIMRAPDANVAPEFASAMTSRTVAENTVAGENIGAPVAATDNNGDALTYALGGTDAASFDIDPDTGQLMTKVALDYETKATYSAVTVAASDSGGLSDSIDVTITVTNVEEAGTVTLSSMTPMVGTELTATLSDPDDSVTGETWQWSKSDAVDGTFADIAGATSSSYTPVEGDASMYLRATAMYTDGEGSGKNAMATTGSAVTAAPSGDPLVAKYDANNNGKIDKPEVIAAIRDYVRDGTISKADVIKLIRMYIRGD